MLVFADPWFRPMLVIAVAGILGAQEREEG
jgi:hypothetical protein